MQNKVIKINKASKNLTTWNKQFAKGIYEPIVKVWSGPKGTRRHLVRPVKSPFYHHLLSDGECRYAMYIESLPRTVRFFDQYPLWDIERLIRLSHELGIRYPVDDENEAYILSTDFLCQDICSKTGKMITVARSYKPTNSILYESKHPVSVNRTLEKLALEEYYWTDIGIPFELITEMDISRQYAANIANTRLAAFHPIEHRPVEASFSYAFLNSWNQDPLEILEAHIHHASESIQHSYSSGFSHFQWCTWSHILPVDTEEKIEVFEPIAMVVGV